MLCTKKEKNFPKYFLWPILPKSFGGPCFYLFIYLFYNKLSCLGLLEKILLSSSSNLALNESNTRLNILPVYEMCHQIHTLINVSFFHGVSIPQVHRAFLKGILGFCVNPILSPYRLQGPSAW